MSSCAVLAVSFGNADLGNDFDRAVELSWSVAINAPNGGLH
jgi:hypothetical protein